MARFTIFHCRQCSRFRTVFVRKRHGSQLIFNVQHMRTIAFFLLISICIFVQLIGEFQKFIIDSCMGI